MRWCWGSRIGAGTVAVSLFVAASSINPNQEDVERLALTFLLVGVVIFAAAYTSGQSRAAQRAANRALVRATEALTEANEHMRQIAKDAYIDGYDRGVSVGYKDGYEDGRRAPLSVVRFPERVVVVGDVGTTTGTDA